MGHDGKSPRAPRCIALVGPYQSGKSTLLEAILARTGGSAKPIGGEANGGSGSEAAPDLKRKSGSTLAVGSTTFMDEVYTFIDCPGSMEFIHDMRAALPVVDAALVVCEADERKIPQLQIILRELEDLQIPRFLFLNKIDKANQRVRDVLAALQPASRTPLVLRQIPIWAGESVSGFVDLALERAFVYRDQQPSEVIDLQGNDLDREKEARFTMLERLADHDDRLMEQLLEDIAPPRDEVFDNLAKELREGQICPVLFGVATRSNGVLRLMKALRHEVQGMAETAKRLGIGKDAGSLAYVIKTVHQQHGGKLSIGRVLSGHFEDGSAVHSSGGSVGKISGMSSLSYSGKRAVIETGELACFGKLDAIRTGETITTAKATPASLADVEPYPGALSVTIAASDRKDDVKLGQAIARLCEEDPSLTVIQDPRTHEAVLWGQGEMHLRQALERLRDRFSVAVVSRPPTIGYQEAIRKAVTRRGRHKKQSGGHGQFGDVLLEIEPLPRGSGFEFHESIVGGAVPKNYIPAVEEGVIEALKRGPLGFQVTDIKVTLVDGSFHTVDSSDLAFRTAAWTGLSEALPECHPVLLEPIFNVEIFCPTDATAKVNAILSGRRAQITGFDTREDWNGWDVVRASMPEAEIRDLIVELRSATAGAGSFVRQFDRMAEVIGRAADQIVAAHRSAA
ncbi:MAG TPA: elongation factor G [Xanthobacteraceae bacterium]|nr:elongation factor G [Xanthobacteraceae bacterium]